jgi:transcription termination/antitermination protein NusG
MSRKWYVVQTYSGFENSVKQDLDRRIESMDMKDKIYQVLIPEEEQEQTKKDGSKVLKTVKMFPGYIFVELEVDKDVDEKAWFMIRNTPKVTGFLGSSGGGAKPVPLPAEEINDILRKIGKLDKPVLDIAVGDNVTITGGPFAGRSGAISGINEEKGLVTVLVELFAGRSTPMEFQFTQVKKA